MWAQYRTLGLGYITPSSRKLSMSFQIVSSMWPSELCDWRNLPQLIGCFFILLTHDSFKTIGSTALLDQNSGQKKQLQWDWTTQTPPKVAVGQINWYVVVIPWWVSDTAFLSLPRSLSLLLMGPLFSGVFLKFLIFHWLGLLFEFF